ncbi:MAG: roadblock/LC7 domain-containing protein [Rhizobiaceae bacterium]|nr:roadblock/LC7 domain-containing protein [Rhizobiaceae bacterium]
MFAYHKDEEFCSNCEIELNSLAERCKGMQAAAIVSSDGFVVSTFGRLKDGGNRLGSMTSSMQALAEAVHEELGMGDNEYITFKSSDGNLVMSRVHDLPLVITALFNDRETVGHAIFSVKQTVDQICGGMPK